MTLLEHVGSFETGRAARHYLDTATVRAWLDGKASEEDLPAPDWGPIGREVFERTYARPKPDGSQESWAECVRRVVLGNLSYADPATWMLDEDVALFELIYTLRALPAGRHLWVTGTPVARFSRNCFVAGWEARTSAHFGFLAARLFEGGGVGANYSADLMAVCNPVLTAVEVAVVCDPGHPDFAKVQEAAGGKLLAGRCDGELVHLVEDSREGWAAAWEHLIDVACSPSFVGSRRVVFDVSGLRPYGAPLRTFGGQASGPAPFAHTAIGMAAVLAGATGRRLRGLEAMAMDHLIAASVVAGGSRRSARMSMMHWRDPEIEDFLSCKADPEAHWSTNISVEVDDEFHEAVRSGDPHATEVFAAICSGMARNGEPGLLDTALASRSEPAAVRATNPCGESFLSTDGAAGEPCNLGSVDLSRFGADHAGAWEAFWLMARFLYRATLLPHHDPAAAGIEARNRRIGVGIMGLQGWAAAQGCRLSELPEREDLLGRLAWFRLAARTSADWLADRLGAPRSVKVTAIAPTGTISQLGGTTSGIHPVVARYFVRRVRFAESDPALPALEASGHEVVDDIYAERTKVVSFPVRDPLLDRYPAELIEQADEIGLSEFLRLVEAVTRAYCGGADGQAVSATAQVPAGTSPEEVAQAVRPYLGHLKGITVFPASSRPLSPIEAIDAAAYAAAVARLGGSETTGSADEGCRGGACPIR